MSGPFWFATTFAFCFEMREGILFFSAFQAMTAIFWLTSSSFTLDSWPHSEGLRGLSIVLLGVNAALGCAASRLSNERFAQALIMTFGLLVLSLTINFGFNHPSRCVSEAQADESALGAPALRCRLALPLLQNSPQLPCGPRPSG